MADFGKGPFDTDEAPVGVVAVGAEGDEPGGDRIVADPPKESVRVEDGGRRITIGDKISDPRLNVAETDGTDRHGGEDGEDMNAQVGLTSGFGRVATVHPSGGRLLGEIAEADPAGIWVDVGAFELAGLDGDEEPFRVQTKREVLRALANR